MQKNSNHCHNMLWRQWNKYRLLIVGVTTIISLAAALVLHFLVKQPWKGMSLYWAIEDGVVEYCEHIYWNSNVRTPWNSYSNIAYNIAGAWIVSDCVASGENTHWPLIVGLSLVLLGCGSFVFHASLTSMGRILDSIGMFWSLNSLIFMLSWRRFQRYRSAHQMGCLLLGVVLAICKSFRPNKTDTTPILISQILLLVIICLFVPPRKLSRIQIRWIFLAVAAISSSFVIRQLEEFGGPLCMPRSVFQGHAWWHLGSACALVCCYESIRIDTPENTLDGYNEDTRDKNADISTLLCVLPILGWFEARVAKCVHRMEIPRGDYEIADIP